MVIDPLMEYKSFGMASQRIWLASSLFRTLIEALFPARTFFSLLSSALRAYLFPLQLQNQLVENAPFLTGWLRLRPSARTWSWYILLIQPDQMFMIRHLG